MGLSLYINEDLAEFEKKEVKEKKEKKVVEIKKSTQPELTKDKMLSKLMDLPDDKMARMLGHFNTKNVFQMSEAQIKEAYQKIFIN